MNVRVRILNDGEYESWDRFAQAASHGGVCSTTAYLDALCSVTGGRFRVVAVDADGRFLAGIALYETHTRWGRVLRPRSLLPYNGFALSSGESQYPSQQESLRNQCLSALCVELESHGNLSMKIRTQGEFLDARVFLERGWQVAATYTYCVGLRNLDAQWSLVDRDLKRQIRKCEASGYVVAEDDDVDSLLDFHFLANRRKGFHPYLPRQAFRAFVDRLRSRGLARVFHVRGDNGDAVASQLVLANDHPTCHIVMAGSDPDHHRHGVNAFLRWRSFEALAACGHELVDLTDASLNPVSRFKSRFGGQLVTSLAVARAGGSTIARLGSGVEHGLRRLLGRA